MSRRDIAKGMHRESLKAPWIRYLVAPLQSLVDLLIKVIKVIKLINTRPQSLFKMLFNPLIQLIKLIYRKL